MPRIYLDHNATTPVAPEVAVAVADSLAHDLGNPSSIHYFGQRAKRKLDEARAQVAALIGADEREIIFTSGGTEANNLALRGAALARQDRGRHLVASAVEHHAVLHTLQRLEREGFAVSYLAPDAQGVIRPETLAAALRPDTVLATVMLANNEVGALQPVAELAALCREKDIAFHTDAVQAVGKIPVDVVRLGVDFLALSGHKFYGPRGVGALYARRGAALLSQMHGGHQERDRRAGTENLPGIVGLGAAAGLAQKNLGPWAAHTAALRDRLEQGIRSRIADVRVFGPPDQRLPNTLSVAFGGTEGESVLMNLDLKGAAVSTGSACSSGSVEPSHVLTAMGVPRAYARAALRFSVGKDNTAEEIGLVVDWLADIVERVRSLSPGYAARAADGGKR